ncbi:hypothetical protein GQ53DRAFT_753241 [Thozetella sp. PMI_491]|nr:hypothetical protein GQ53DRAFT_753241 [Thozetella sp. PMI_491]
MKSFVTLALAATASAKVAVMVPFYKYPTFDSTGALDSSWQGLFTAADAHPDLHFYVVVNPDNGPTARSSGAYQDQPYGFNEDWVTALDKLNTRKNVQTIGYVSTLGCTLAEPRTMAAMQADIENWSHWSTTTNATGWGTASVGGQFNISVSGIFFDETASQNDASGSVLSCYRTLKSYADSKFKASGRPAAQNSVVFNPGVAVTTSMYELFTLGDAVINTETCYTDVPYPDGECGTIGKPISWTPFTAALMRSSPTTFLPADQTLWPKTSVLVHGFNTVSGSSKPADAATLADAIKSVVERGVHSLYFTTKGWQSFADAPASITTVAQDIANVA